MTKLCSCGEAHAHKIAERLTADGARVVAWSDGDVTGKFGLRPRGLGRPRGGISHAALLRTAWLVIGEVELYDWHEVARLVKVARKAVVQNCLVSDAYVRRTMAGEKFHFNGSVVTKK